MVHVKKNCLLLFLHDIPFYERHRLWFQQDGATVLSSDTLSHGLVTCIPASSPNLTVPESLLSGFAKTKVCKTYTATHFGAEPEHSYDNRRDSSEQTFYDG